MNFLYALFFKYSNLIKKILITKRNGLVKKLEAMAENKQRVIEDSKTQIEAVHLSSDICNAEAGNRYL